MVIDSSSIMPHGTGGSQCCSHLLVRTTSSLHTQGLMQGRDKAGTLHPTLSLAKVTLLYYSMS